MGPKRMVREPIVEFPAFGCDCANRCGERDCESDREERRWREMENRGKLDSPSEGVDIKRTDEQAKPGVVLRDPGSFPNSFHGPEVGVVFALSIGFPSVVGANGTTNADCRCRDADSRGVGYAPRSTYTSNETSRERNGGTLETERESGSREKRAEQRRQNPLPPFSLTISVFARERGSFSLSESLSVYVTVNVQGVP